MDWNMLNKTLLTNVFPSFLDLHRIMSGFHGAFATGMACQQGKLILPDTWFRPPSGDLLMLQLSRPDSSNLPCLNSTFHLEYPLVLSRFCFSMFLHLYWSNNKTIQILYDYSTRQNTLLHVPPVISKRKRKRSDSVLWQKPLHPQKNPKKQRDNTKTAPKLRLHNDCGPT